MRPIPITPSVLLYSSTPSKFFLSQCLLRTFASACGILRATESNNENACSAVEIVFPPGAFNTTTPRRVAVSTSTLSTPTPARPTTRSLLPAFKISAVTFGLAAHHQRAERRNQFDKFALVQAGFNRDLQRVLAREFVHSALRNGIGDEDLRRSHGSLTFKRSIRSHKCHSERSEESLIFF